MPACFLRNLKNELPAAEQRVIRILNGKPCESENQLTKAYTFFEKKLREVQFEHEKLKKIITSYFSVVSIVLDANDNPYLVFESLNAKGRPLTQTDLIRNYFFMRIHLDKQDEVYNVYWQPMQTALNASLTEYIRHFLMKDGSVIKQNDVYYALKERVSLTNAIDYLKELQKYLVYYQRLIYPEFEPEEDLQKYFRRLNRIEVTTAYPLLLNFYSNYVEDKIGKADFITILKTLENYLIRRFVCNVPTNQLNKIFPAVYPQLITKFPDNLIEGLKQYYKARVIQKTMNFIHGSGKQSSRCWRQAYKNKLILETLEEGFAHKEAVPFDNLTIEHVMPQTLSEWWQNHLGDNWEETHELFLHTIGNLTLSAYNTELSNDDFTTKKQTYNESHLELNKYFSPISFWTRSEIEKRAEVLAIHALEIWIYFGQEKATSSDLREVTGTTPTELRILVQQFQVQTWRDVLEQTLNTIAYLEPDKFEIIAHNFPRYIGKDKNKFRAVRQLQNG